MFSTTISQLLQFLHSIGLFQAVVAQQKDAPSETKLYVMFEVPCCRLNFILSSVLSVHFKHHAGVLKQDAPFSSGATHLPLYNIRQKRLKFGIIPGQCQVPPPFQNEDRDKTIITKEFNCKTLQKLLVHRRLNVFPHFKQTLGTSIIRHQKD